MIQRQTLGSIFTFWASLAGTLLMIAAEPIIIISQVSRQPDPKLNLGAYGVVLAIGIFCEAPVLRLLSASIAFVRGSQSYAAFRGFAYVHSVLMSVVLLAICFDPVLSFVGRTLLGLDERMFQLLQVPLLIYTPAPFLVGYRRFLQGLLINGGEPGKVTQTTFARLFVVAVSAVVLPRFELSGVAIGSACHTLGMLAEAIAARILVRNRLRALATLEEHLAPGDVSFRKMAQFYYPLALATAINLLGPPVETYFLARGALPIESLALLPVVNSVLNPFSWSGYAIQDTFIALYDRDKKQLELLRRFQRLLALGMTVLFGMFVVSPLLETWFLNINEIPPVLVPLAIQAAILLIPLPGAVVWKAGERGILVKRGATNAMLVSEILEIVLLVTLLWITVFGFGISGLLAVLAANTVSAILNAFWLRFCVRKLDE